MKTAETPPTPQPARGHASEASLGHAALVAGRDHTKILAPHWTKLAVISVRQSSLQQVLENRASTAHQYALRDYAVALGWPATRVLPMDEDQGQSGTSAQARPGSEPPRSKGVGPWFDSSEAHSLQTHPMVNLHFYQNARP